MQFSILKENMVDIVQLVRASVCGTECRGFESHYPPHLFYKARDIYRDIAKSVRHQILILACVGSSPAIPAILYGPLAQSAEHLTFNQVVRGSNLRWLTKTA